MRLYSFIILGTAPVTQILRGSGMTPLTQVGFRDTLGGKGGTLGADFNTLRGPVFTDSMQF